MRARAGGRRVDGEAGDEVVDGAGDRVDRDPRRRRSRSRRPCDVAEHDVVERALLPEAAVLPGDVDGAVAGDLRARQRAGAQVAGDAVEADRRDLDAFGSTRRRRRWRRTPRSCRSRLSNGTIDACRSAARPAGRRGPCRGRRSGSGRSTSARRRSTCSSARGRRRRSCRARCSSARGTGSTRRCRRPSSSCRGRPCWRPAAGC